MISHRKMPYMSSVGLSPPEEHLSVSIVTAQPSHLQPVDKCLQVPLQSLISCFHHLYLASCRWENAFTLSLNTRNQSIGSSESMRHWASLVGQGGINNMLFISLTSAPHHHPSTVTFLVQGTIRTILLGLPVSLLSPLLWIPLTASPEILLKCKSGLL